MKVLVTGSNGCVGSALKTLCENDSDYSFNDCIFINRKDCDLLDRERTIKFFSDIKPDYIIHLASYVPGFYNIDRVRSFSDNVRINENVLEASHIANIDRGLFCLSVNMFADEEINFPLFESKSSFGTLAGPFSGYGYSKRMLELQYKNYNLQYNRKYFGIIPSNIYGPNDNMKSGRLIPNLILKFKEAVKNNTDVIINGSGKPLRQFIYSYDLAKIIKYLTYNYSNINSIICCGDEEISIKELANKISESFNFKNKIIFDTNKPDGVFRKTIGNNYLKEIMPDISFTKLEKGLKETIRLMDI